MTSKRSEILMIFLIGLIAAAPMATDQKLRALKIFPRDNPWNQDVSDKPVDPKSDAILKRIGSNKPLHPDFGTVYNGEPNGIPFVLVPANQPKVNVKFQYVDESDKGRYPIPADALIEGGPNSS